MGGGVEAVTFSCHRKRCHSSGSITTKCIVEEWQNISVRMWDELIAYSGQRQLEIDNNIMENAIRPVALGRKN